MADTMQKILTKRLADVCGAWGIQDAEIAAGQMARIALETLQYPTDEMCSAVRRAAWFSASGQKPENVWRAGIMASLNPSPVPAE